MAEKLRWGVMGTGGIARAFATKIQPSETSELVAVSSRNKDQAEAFGNEYNVANRYEGYGGVLTDDQVEVVYISMIHPLHCEWAIKAAQAGKHILLEKPMAMNTAEAKRVMDAVRKAGVYMSEAFMYRYHPQTAKILEIIKAGMIGDIKVISAAFSFHWRGSKDHRIIAHDLGGGAILDLGCYPVSMSRLIAGAAFNKPFLDPLEVQAFSHIGPESRVDMHNVAIMKFPGDVLAQATVGIDVNQENTVRIYGSDGSIHVPIPWGPCHEPGDCMIFFRSDNDDGAQEVTIPVDRGLFTIEIDAVAENIRAGLKEAPQMTWADSMGNIKTLDTWREAVGLKYDFE